MTGVELLLLLIGAVFMIGSFFVTEKLSVSELNKIAEMSEGELKSIVNHDLERVSARIEEAIDGKLEETLEKSERALERETNEKIMAINEYSDTVVESMNKTHNEIMFLYNMLNDKHTELTGLTADLQRLAADIRNVQENAPTAAARVPEAGMPEPADFLEPEAEPDEIDPAKLEDAKENHYNEILALHKEGVRDVEIAKKFGLGLGEVRLVIGLYKGDINS